jgi:hypothetical protein
MQGALVYANLEESRNHLRAFVANLDQRSFSYTPDSSHKTSTIVSSFVERCRTS